MPVKLIDGKCTGSGECVPACPTSVLELPEGAKVVVLANLEACIECGCCVAACPESALEL
ncbi:Ferredoxin Fd1, Fd2 [Giardia muris]|uniref:Ferredoxin Fd1, Fd2 n=1 Tax=Giardia muris TaxID=5742 RepID=A0A4Z1SLE2_GIAMU|nr:Ferredoxin Fd1, Fd2 [Giardia muris]|eukprot:TNJ26330.1 Ferredoxin Fd1, Fd2 [Giardia muris]